MTVSGFAGDPDRYKPLTRIFIYLPQGGEVARPIPVPFR